MSILETNYLEKCWILVFNQTCLSIRMTSCTFITNRNKIEDESICTMFIDILVDTDCFCGKLFVLFAFQVILYNLENMI